MSMLKIPVTAKDHIQGDETAPVDSGGVWGLPMPALRACVSDRQSACRSISASGWRFVFRNFPLNEMHPNAEAAAETAEFAAAKGKFWEMHDAIFENQGSLSLPMLLELAKELGLSEKGLGSALKEQGV